MTLLSNSLRILNVGISKTMEAVPKVCQWSCLKKQSAELAASMIKKGKIIAVPTDTIYGLAGLAQDNDSIFRLYKIKKRSFQKPLAICLADIADIPNWAYSQDLPEGLVEALLPGPTTLILRRKPALNTNLNPGVENVGIRIPDSHFVRKIVQFLKQPLALTSANESNCMSSLHPEEFKDLWPMIDGIFYNETKIIKDPETWRKGSTVVDLSAKGAFKIVRVGIGFAKTFNTLKHFKLKEFIQK